MTKLIAPYITEAEYQCDDCGGYPLDFDEDNLLVIYELLFSAFKHIREEWGKPIHITSGYRCGACNSLVGGTPMSAHMFGCALDLDLSTVDEVYKLEDIIEELHPELRRGTYTRTGTFIHFDNAYLIFPRGNSHWREGARWEG